MGIGPQLDQILARKSQQSSIRRTRSYHLVTLGFLVKGSSDASDILQVPWGKGEHRAEACSGDNVGGVNNLL